MNTTNKPNWEDAPDWANWLAKDHDGVWYWYDVIPDLEQRPANVDLDAQTIAIKDENIALRAQLADMKLKYNTLQVEFAALSKAAQRVTWKRLY